MCGILKEWKNTKQKGSEEITPKEIRKILKISHLQMARMLGISNTTLHYRETGKQPWTLPEMARLCEIVDEPLTVFCDGNKYLVSIQKVA